MGTISQGSGRGRVWKLINIIYRKKYSVASSGGGAVDNNSF